MIKQQLSIRLYICLALTTACIVAAIALILVRFEARSLQAELDYLDQVKLGLREQNRRYLIEIASFTDYPELHQKAMQDYAMIFPNAKKGTLINIDDLREERNIYSLARLQND